VIHVHSLGGQFHRVRKSHGYQKTRLSPLRKVISEKRNRWKYTFPAGLPTTRQTGASIGECYKATDIQTVRLI
jgi:hypothetical protein